MRAILAGTAATMAMAASLAGCGDRAARDPSGNTVTVATPTAPASTAGTTVPATPASFAVTDGWAGKWVGVEGLALTIAKAQTPGAYRLHVSLMDGTNDYDGRAEGDVIRFTRDGKSETIRHGTGAETGLKWLAGKRDCLIIRDGEGFCRG